MFYHFCFLLLLVAASNGQQRTDQPLNEFSSNNTNVNLVQPPRSPNVLEYGIDNENPLQLNGTLTLPTPETGRFLGRTEFQVPANYPGIQVVPSRNGEILRPNETELSPIQDPNFPSIVLDTNQNVGNVRPNENQVPPTQDTNNSGFGLVPIDNGGIVGPNRNQVPPTQDTNNSGFGLVPIDNGGILGPNSNQVPPTQYTNNSGFGRVSINNGGIVEPNRNQVPSTQDTNNSGFGRVPIDNGGIVEPNRNQLPPTQDTSNSGLGRVPIENGGIVVDSRIQAPPTQDTNNLGFGRVPINNGGIVVDGRIQVPPTQDFTYQREPNNNGGMVGQNGNQISQNQDSNYPGFGIVGPNGNQVPLRQDPYYPIFGRNPNLNGGIVWPYGNRVPPSQYPNRPGFRQLPNNNAAVVGPDGNEIPSTQDLENSGFDQAINENEYESTTETSRDTMCRKQFSYNRIDSKCDAYIECRGYRAAEKLCPDGMYFNADARWPQYPCGYPADVPCRGRGSIQPPKPTAECPNQYGFFEINNASLSPKQKCSQYLMCAEGIAVVMDCPFGLAFNPATARCDWPELVPSCKDFLGFQCPAAPLGKNGLPLNIVVNYQYSADECYYFYSCEKGRVRVLSCDYGLAFDPNSGRCIDQDLVQCKQRDRTPEPEYETNAPAAIMY